MLKTLLLTITAGGVLCAWSKPVEAIQRIHEADQVFNEIMSAPDKGIPQDLLSKAHCVGIVPSMKKGGFLVGARYGKGVMLCREQGGAGWTGPSTVRVEGGSFGLQAGGSAVDVVLLVMNEHGAQKLMRSEFTLGGDATVAAGPVGRSVQAETDALMHAEILSYSRARGVFAGVALRGATLRADDDDNSKIYSRPVDHKQILNGKVNAPPAAVKLIHDLNKYSSREK